MDYIKIETDNTGVDQSCGYVEMQELQGLSSTICFMPAALLASVMALSCSLPAAGFPVPAPVPVILPPTPNVGIHFQKFCLRPASASLVNTQFLKVLSTSIASSNHIYAMTKLKSPLLTSS